VARDQWAEASEVKRAHVRLVACLSVDGRISVSDDKPPNQRAKGGWTSPEDKELFRDELKEADIVLMGRRTYEISPAMGKPTVVLTKGSVLTHPKVKPVMKLLTGKKSEMEDFLAGFHNARVLLCGGAQAYTSMLQMGLVDSMSIVVEPIILGSGPTFCSPHLFWTEASSYVLQHKRTNLLGCNGTIHIEYERTRG
jgi:dihydrofolate reductase